MVDGALAAHEREGARVCPEFPLPEVREYQEWRNNWRGVGPLTMIEGREMILAIVLADKAIAALKEVARREWLRGLYR
jgi:hypothetical protein